MYPGDCKEVEQNSKPDWRHAIESLGLALLIVVPIAALVIWWALQTLR